MKRSEQRDRPRGGSPATDVHDSRVGGLPAVPALIRDAAEELAQQVAVRTVQLDPAKPAASSGCGIPMQDGGLTSTVAARSLVSGRNWKALALHGCWLVNRDGARALPWKIWTTPSAHVRQATPRGG